MSSSESSDYNSDNTETDIYGDLESTIFEATKHQLQINQQSSSHSKEINACRAEIKELHHVNRKILKENQTLRANISSLYLTAKTEMEKKNFIIKQLQQRLNDKGHNCACMTPIDTGESLKQLILSEMERTLQDIKSRKKKKNPKKKIYRMGNMSLYLARSQAPFKREAQIEFPSRT